MIMLTADFDIVENGADRIEVAAGAYAAFCVAEGLLFGAAPQRTV